MKIFAWLACFVAAQVAVAGEFKLPYYTGTTPGGWALLQLTDKDGTVSDFIYTRKPDADGQAVLELSVKTSAGVAAGSESSMIYTMPAGFDLANLGHSYGKFIEKMVMVYGDMETPVDDATLEVIRQAEKDFRGKVTFIGAETIGALSCDRYAYTTKSDTSLEKGTLWLNNTIPFALVKQTGQVVNTDGAIASDFQMVLIDHGQDDLSSSDEDTEPAPEPPAQPITTTLAEGFQSGYIGLDATALAGGKQLSMNLRNEHTTSLTIEIPAGPVDFKVNFPVETLRVTIPKTIRLVLEAGASSQAMTVTQRGTRGVTEGTFYLSIYEGTPVFQGSVTMGDLPK